MQALSFNNRFADMSSLSYTSWGGHYLANKKFVSRSINLLSFHNLKNSNTNKKCEKIYNLKALGGGVC